MNAGSASEDVDASAAGTDGTGEGRRKGFVSRLISMPNEESDDSIQNTIYEIHSQCGRERLQTDMTLLGGQVRIVIDVA